MTRDPRFHPQAGDVLRRDGIERTVECVKSVGCWYDVYYRTQGERREKRIRCYSGTWEKWAKGAEVVTAA